MNPIVMVAILLAGFVVVRLIANQGDKTSHNLAHQIGQGDRSSATMVNGCGALLFFSLLLITVLLAAAYATEVGGFLGAVP